MSSIVIKNIGTILSGDIDNPILKGDTIVVTDGKIAAVGGAEVADGIEAEKVIDAAGSTVTPGLFDTHVHTSLGDYAHRQFASNFIEGSCTAASPPLFPPARSIRPAAPRIPRSPRRWPSWRISRSRRSARRRKGSWRKPDSGKGPCGEGL